VVPATGPAPLEVTLIATGSYDRTVRSATSSALDDSGVLVIRFHRVHTFATPGVASRIADRLGFDGLEVAADPDVVSPSSCRPPNRTPQIVVVSANPQTRHRAAERSVFSSEGTRDPDGSDS
jgi:hypothetical protein